MEVGKTMKRNLILFELKWILLFLVTVLLISRCGPVGMKEINLPPTTYNKIPLKIGLYISPGFRNYIYSPHYPQSGKYLVGDGLSKTADILFKEIFKEVILIDGMSNIATDIKAIISPEIIETFFIGFSPEFHIVCKWTIISPGGKVYYMNTITGIGMGDRSFNGMKRISVALTNAVKDHYEKLLAHIHSTYWWENIEK
jgi:hypothetical protein